MEKLTAEDARQQTVDAIQLVLELEHSAEPRSGMKKAYKRARNQLAKTLEIQLPDDPQDACRVTDEHHPGVGPLSGESRDEFVDRQLRKAIDHLETAFRCYPADGKLKYRVLEAVDRLLTNRG